MNKEIKEKWVKALRSGEYDQTRRALHDKNGFCCLGVLCDLHSKESGERWVSERDGDSKLTYMGWVGILPGSVEDWANVRSLDMENLAHLNDNLFKDFAQIADYIEENL